MLDSAFRLGRFFLVALALGQSVAPAEAAPKLDSLSLRGLQSGATTKLTLKGSDLGANPRLSLPIPVASQKLLPTSNHQQAVFEVTLDAATPAGIYPLRLINAHGISNPVLVAVDALPQVPVRKEIDQLPIALHGSTGGASAIRKKFSGKAGERVVVEVEARRLGSPISPVLRLYDDKGLQLAWSQSLRRLQGDARIETTLPRDGQYEVELHDAAYRGAAGYFRLKIGDLNYAHFAWPLAVERRATSKVSLLGSPRVENSPQEVVTSELLATALDWPSVPHVTGARPWCYVSRGPEYLETQSASAVQSLPALPSGVSGRIAAPRETDVYQFPVKPGAKLRFDLIAARIGSPLDGVLTLRDAQGKRLAENDDDSGSLDPRVTLTVPEGVEQLQLAVRDLTRRGGESFVYRVAVEPLDEPQVQVKTDQAGYAIPRGGSALITLTAERRGYEGPIAVDLGPWPSAITVSVPTIPAGASRALVSLTAEDREPPRGEANFWTTALAARASDDLPPVPVMAGPTASAFERPWLAQQATFAVTSPGLLRAMWEGLTATEAAKPGAKLAVQVKLLRGADAGGQVRLSLVTTQDVPKKKVKKDKKEQEVDDLDRALRLAGDPVIEAGASEAAVTILVPDDLPPGVYDVAIKAALLSGDGKKELATAFTPVVRLSVAK